MKTHFLLLLVLVSLSAAGLGWRLAPKDQYRLTMTPVFQSDDELVWQLTIETHEPARYRVMSVGVWGGGDLPGWTVLKKRRASGCEAKVWLVVSQIVPSSDGPAYVKTILQGESGTVSQTREVSQHSKLGGMIRETKPRAAETHPLNTPLKIGGIDGQDIRLIVGAQAEGWKTK